MTRPVSGIGPVMQHHVPQARSTHWLGRSHPAGDAPEYHVTHPRALTIPRVANGRRRCRKCGATKPLAELVVVGIQAHCAGACEPKSGRTGMVRTGMARTAGPKRTRMKRRRSAELDAYEAELKAARPLVAARSQGRCEVAAPGCTTKATHVHHRKPRSQGGSNDLAALTHSCQACHLFIHAHPTLSYEQGWLIRTGNAR